MEVNRIIRVWWIYTRNSFLPIFNNKLVIFTFIISKVLRIGVFALFLYFLFQGTNRLAGYNREQIIFFYLSFTLVDTLGQFLFREVYRFKQLILQGNFDYVLIKPVNPLIRVLLGGADLFDSITFVILSTIIYWYGTNFISSNLYDWIFYILLLLNALVISTAFHICVLGLGIITTSIDHLMMVYRDLASLARIPVDIYTQPIRSIITFAIPIGIMMTFPPKVLMGLLSWQYIVLSAVLGLTFLLLALKFWKYSIRFYQSASS